MFLIHSLKNYQIYLPDFYTLFVLKAKALAPAFADYLATFVTALLRVMATIPISRAPSKLRTAQKFILVLVYRPYLGTAHN